MGLFDFFRSRREKEGAIGSASLSASSHQDSGNVKLSGGLGIGEAWDMTKQIKEAMEKGNFTVDQQSASIDARGNEELRNAILGALREHGIDAEKGQQVQVTDPAAIKAVFQTLSEHSDDLAAMQQQALANFGGLQGAQIGSGGADPSVDQLERLQKLREQGVLTDEEFDKQKRKIIGK